MFPALFSLAFALAHQISKLQNAANEAFVARQSLPAPLVSFVFVGRVWTCVFLGSHVVAWPSRVYLPSNGHVFVALSRTREEEKENGNDHTAATMQNGALSSMIVCAPSSFRLFPFFFYLPPRDLPTTHLTNSHYKHVAPKTGEVPPTLPTPEPLRRPVPTATIYEMPHASGQLF